MPSNQFRQMQFYKQFRRTATDPIRRYQQQQVAEKKVREVQKRRKSNV